MVKLSCPKGCDEGFYIWKQVSFRRRVYLDVNGEPEGDHDDDDGTFEENSIHEEYERCIGCDGKVTKA